MDPTASAGRCHACDSARLEEIPGYGSFWRVTSDCKPWRPGGRLAVCKACGTVQKAIDPGWRAEVAEIYGAYEIYHQSGGAEQAVFEATGEASLRSDRILARLGEQVALPGSGRMLDIGCGNGPMLRAFSRFAPRWSLVGWDLDDRCRGGVESIAGVEAFYSGPPEGVPGGFDVVTLIHVLEHIPSPLGTLAALRDRLGAGGRLVVEVPDLLQNPFDLLVADHASHFTPRTLRGLLRAAGYPDVSVATDWVFKELTAVGLGAGGPGPPEAPEADPATAVVAMLGWLHDVVSAAGAPSGPGPSGIFGTSISAMWLRCELGDGVDFFVDEDRNRVGREFMGRPVYHPDEAPAGSDVFLVLPPAVAERAWRRLSASRSRARYHRPPEFPAAQPGRAADHPASEVRSW